MTDDVVAGYSDGDVNTNTSENPTLNTIVSQRYSRRQTLFGGLSATAIAVFGASMLAACSDDADAAAPVVSAGENGSTTSGRMVTLQGSSAGSDASALVFAWRQTGGPAVTLEDADTTAAKFLAPSVSSPTALTFAFTVRDSSGNSSTAETIVTVGPAVLGFTAVPKSLEDIVVVPAGYTASVLYRLGDPLAAGVSAYANDGTDGGFAHRAGDQNDALH